MSKSRGSKSSKSRSDKAVQGTNDNSIVSKLSMSEQGYFTDDFVRHFVDRPSRRSPIINRIYYIRARAVDHALTSFLEQFRDSPKQIVSLGAGFDAQYFRLKAKGQLSNTVYIEVDFADVVEQKLSMIQQTEALLALLDAPAEPCTALEMSSASYKLVAADLTKLSDLSTKLRGCGVDFSQPTLLLSEVVLTYIKPTNSSAVIQWAAKTFPSGVFVTYEQVYPQDGFGRFMCRHFQHLGSPLKNITSYPSPASQVHRYDDLGWQLVTAVDMNYFYYNIVDPEERCRVEGLELFDEHEEWHLSCGHYILLTAFTGRCISLETKLWRPLYPGDPDLGSKVSCSVQQMDHGDDATSEKFPVSRSPDVGISPNLCELQSLDKDCVKGEQLQESVLCSGVNSACAERCSAHRDGSKVILSAVSQTTPHSGARNQPNWARVTLEQLPVEDVEGDWCRRFGHTSSLMSLRDSSNVVEGGAGDQNAFLVTIGGFGQQRGKHCRLKDLVISSFTTKGCGRSHQDGDPPKTDTCGFRLCPPRRCSVVVPGTGAGDQGKVESVLERMYHTSTVLSDGRMLLIGGRTSPAKPCSQVLLLDFTIPSPSDDSIADKNGKKYGNKPPYSDCDTRMNDASLLKGESAETVKCDCSVMHATGTPPDPRWRHSATRMVIGGEECIIVYGGRTPEVAALGDCYRLTINTWTWTQISITGTSVGARHSHTADQWGSTVVIAGGLDSTQRPLGGVHLLDAHNGKCSTLSLQSNVRPRYSHTSSVLGDRLLLHGGVTLTYPPPGVTIVHLVHGSVLEYQLPDCFPLERPLMLHSHSSASLSDGRQIVITGGGGNCFSFGTLFNAVPMLLTLLTDSSE